MFSVAGLKVLLSSITTYWSIAPSPHLVSYLEDGGAEVTLYGEGPQGMGTQSPAGVGRMPATSTKGHRVASWYSFASHAKGASEYDLVFLLDQQALALSSLYPRSVRRIAYLCEYGPPKSLASYVARAAARRAVSTVGLVIAPEEAKLLDLIQGETLVPCAIVPNSPGPSARAEILQCRAAREGLLHGVGLDPSLPTLVQAGGVAAPFGVSCAIDAFAGAAVNLVFIGENRVPARDNLASNVHFTGNVDDADWYSWMSAADVGLALWLPGESGQFENYLRYNTPLSWNRLYWYLAAGLPIIAAGHTALAQFVECSGTGTFVSGTPESLRQGLATVYAAYTGYRRRAEWYFQENNFDSALSRALDCLSGA